MCVVGLWGGVGWDEMREGGGLTLGLVGGILASIRARSIRLEATSMARSAERGAVTLGRWALELV